MIFPPKLKPNDEIRIIAPARSLKLMSDADREHAQGVLEKLGFKVSFGKHVYECDEFSSSSITSRVDDLHAAFADENVKAILSVIGGYNSNQLLDYIDFELIQKNPKIVCGYSDITALLNAIYAKTNVVTYYGPHFSTFGAIQGNEYTVQYFLKCLSEQLTFPINPSADWSDDVWYLNQNDRHFIKNSGFTMVQEGAASGIILGGNLCTFNLLMGTSYFPSIKKDIILFLEDDDWPGPLTAVEFDRNLQALIHLPFFDQVKGIIIGRFQVKSAIDQAQITTIIASKPVLKSIPIIYNADFGHTLPMFTFPIGGTAKLLSTADRVELEILDH